ALELTIMVARERNDGTVATVFYPGRDQSHHALVPRLVIDADAAGQSRLVETIDKGERLVAHRRLDVAALVVDAVERFRAAAGGSRVVGEQAFDPDGHVIESPRRI